jgi:hypothetical protein
MHTSIHPTATLRIYPDSSLNVEFFFADRRPRSAALLVGWLITNQLEWGKTPKASAHEWRNSAVATTRVCILRLIARVFNVKPNRQHQSYESLFLET